VDVETSSASLPREETLKSALAHAQRRVAPETVERLQYAGRWLHVNGEAIYNTRPRRTFREGRTSGSPQQGWPHCLRHLHRLAGETFTTEAVRAVKGSPITMLGVDKPLEWRMEGNKLSSLHSRPPCRS